MSKFLQNEVHKVKNISMFIFVDIHFKYSMKYEIFEIILISYGNWYIAENIQKYIELHSIITKKINFHKVLWY